MMNRSNPLPLPAANVEPVSIEATTLTTEQLRSLFCNPLYVGIGEFPKLIEDDTWIRSATRLIKEEGSEQFLVNLIHLLRHSLDTQASE